jgi:iron complex transport system substrate-binding protein
MKKLLALTLSILLLGVPAAVFVAAQEAVTVEITDIHGTVAVPFKPRVVVALDNRSFDTLYAWGIRPAAVPKAVMPADSPYVLDKTIADIGDHREPDLELLAALEPDLIIVGQRFMSFYDEIRALAPNAAVIDLAFDVSETAENPGEALVNGLKDSTTALGLIFDRKAEAETLNAAFDQAIARAKAAYNGNDTIMSVIVSGGNIGFSAPGAGRVWGPMYSIFGWQSSLDIEGSSSDHQGDDINVEAIAQSNPDWIFVLDRDAAVASSQAPPARDVIDNAPALQNVTAVRKGQIVYAPADTYTNESIQTYLTLFGDLAAALSQ